MADVVHSALTAANLHEPLGADTATAGQYYRADGAGSGTWLAKAYGNIYTINSDSHTIATIGTTAKKFAAFLHDGPSSLTTVAHGTDQITVTNAGDYNITFSAAISTVGAGDAGEYHFHVYVDGVISTIGTARDMSGSADIGAMSCDGIIALTAGQVLTIWVSSDEGSDTDDLNINHASLTVVRVD